MIDLIIVNYNSTDYLLKCLESVYNSLKNLTANVYVQDNGSGDDAERISVFFPKAILIQNNYNIGFSRAVNQALRQSSAAYIFLLNPDAVVLDNFFIPILNFMETHPDAGIVGPKILDSDGTIQGSARAFPNALTALYGRSSPLTRLFPNNLISHSNIMTIGFDGKSAIEVDWVSGACMVVRRKVIEDVGLMDERFFMYWEDADWCRRMREKGWKVVYYPQASIYHHVGKSSHSRPLRSIYHFHKSAYRLHEKYTKFPLSLLNPLVLALLAIRGIIASVISILKKKKSPR